MPDDKDRGDGGRSDTADTVGCLGVFAGALSAIAFDFLFLFIDLGLEHIRGYRDPNNLLDYAGFALDLLLVRLTYRRSRTFAIAFGITSIVVTAILCVMSIIAGQFSHVL
jgi:hypothetical protein